MDKKQSPYYKPSYTVLVMRMIIHNVTEGETLSSVAVRYGISREWLEEINGLEGIPCLSVGQALAIVFPLVTHTVQSGDSLYSIAATYGTTVSELYKNNLRLKGKPDITVGESIVIQIDRTPFGAKQIGGYAYPTIRTEVLNTALPFMNYLIPFTYGFTRTGELVPPDDALLLERAAVYGSAPLMHLSTLDSDGTFSTENGTYLLNNRALWDVLLQNIISTMQSKGFKGLDVDFEYLGKENAVLYAEFITYLRENLNPLGYGVIVALAPKTSDDQPGVLYEGHDFALLGEAANAVLVMTYEWGYTYGPAQAVAPIPNVRRVIEYAVTRIPPEKIFQGIPNYGYDFTLPYVAGESRADSLSTREAYELACRTGSVIAYDNEVLSPYFYYTSGNKTHVVWFEDVRSIRAKLLIPFEYGLKGALYWNLDRENAQNLTVLNSYILSPQEISLL